VTAPKDEPLGLSPEQLLMRQTALGASEVPVVLDMYPWKTALDVWADKATPSRGPIPREDGDAEEDGPGMVGHELEETLLRMFTRRTGIEVRHNKETLRHPESPILIATPDGISPDGTVLVQCKVVGQNTADHHWAADGELAPPDYVRTQVLSELEVVPSAQRCFIAALIGGSRFRIFEVARDEEEQALIREAAESWWCAYVLGDEPPPALSFRERKAALALRFGQVTKDLIAADDDIAELVRWRQFGTALAKVVKERVDEITLTLLERLGTAYGAEGPWGKVIAPVQRGNPSWKDIAEELAGGVVPDAIIDKHRGPAFRAARVYEAKNSEPKRLGRKR
jgi:predicted phage-related endonuclease